MDKENFKKLFVEAGFKNKQELAKALNLSVRLWWYFMLCSSLSHLRFAYTQNWTLYLIKLQRHTRLTPFANLPFVILPSARHTKEKSFYKFAPLRLLTPPPHERQFKNFENKKWNPCKTCKRASLLRNLKVV